jgi:N6-L-threonylcarbamoyladenine synthase
VILLAFETSCDETSVAVVRDGTVLSSAVSSQIKLHAEFGGVVPELAARQHLRNLPAVTRAALGDAGLSSDRIEAVAATLGPGLAGALLVGARAGQAFAFARGAPFAGIHHHEAHLYSPWIHGRPLQADFSGIKPHVALIASGGHTLLVEVRAELDHRVLGGTLDDAAGECFDKVAKLMGLPYPGGPVIDRLAGEGDPRAFDLPRPMLREPSDNFSFSGLKTAVRYLVQRQPGLVRDPRRLRDLCASVEAAIVEVLVAKLVNAARRLQVGCVTASGGVSCNRAFRALLVREASAGLEVRLAEPTLCTDNAAMVGILAERKLLRGLPSTSLDEEVRPSWALGESQKG